jgi:hypothetical protein
MQNFDHNIDPCFMHIAGTRTCASMRFLLVDRPANSGGHRRAELAEAGAAPPLPRGLLRHHAAVLETR